MRLCANCSTLEGSTKYIEATKEQAEHFCVEEGSELLQCLECDAIEEFEHVPEHDDCDMDR